MGNWFSSILNCILGKQKTEHNLTQQKDLPANEKSFEFLLNDPANHQLKRVIVPPDQLNTPNFTVIGYEGGGFSSPSAQWQAAQVFTTIANTLNDLNSLIEEPVTKWSKVNKLIVVPRAGKMLNAYYDRKSLSFFYDKDLLTEQTVFLADSHDIVSHELGHAILDSIRPDLWNIASLEIAAYHEAFADVIALLATMMYDEVLQYALDQTKGDLHQNNILSRLAEQLGKTTYDNKLNINFDCLRNLNNSLLYLNPSVLPHRDPLGKLTCEPHNFSRIMSGAYYDVLINMYNLEKEKGQESFSAIKTSRNVFVKYLFKSIKHIDITNNIFKNAAQGFLNADIENGGIYQDVINSAFLNRNIIIENEMKILRKNKQKHSKRTIILKENLPIRISAKNPLLNVQVEVPDEGIDSILYAYDFINYIYENEKFGNNNKTPFEIINGKLMRSYFSCGSCNFQNKYQPEYNRPWKPENNAGCGCHRKTQNHVEVKPKPKIGCFLTYKISK